MHAIHNSIRCGTLWWASLRTRQHWDCAFSLTRTSRLITRGHQRQHTVRAYLSAGMHKGWASVTLFGGLSYIVELTRAFDERDSRHYSLFNDVECRTQFNPVVLFSEQELLGRVLSPTTNFEEPEAIDEQWWPVVAEYCKAKGIEITRTQVGEAEPQPPS
jgi:hypothetical protein